MRPFRRLDVHHQNHICLEESDANQTLFAVVLPFVLAGHFEVVPDCITSNKVKSMIFDAHCAL